LPVVKIFTDRMCANTARNVQSGKEAARATQSKTGRTSLSGPLRCSRPPVSAAILRVTVEENQQSSHTGCAVAIV
jgi:hypothetical protein